MKTIESVITGRKDFPIFASSSSNEEIIEYMEANYWVGCIIEVNEDGLIELEDDENETDIFKIIYVEHIEL